MTIQDLNGWKIQVNEPFKYFNGGFGPGAYDWLEYKGHEIWSMEGGNTKNGLYVGPFGVDNEGNIIMVQNLTEAQTIIDKLEA